MANKVRSPKLAIIISYPTNTSRIIYCFIKNAHKISRILPDFNLFVETTDFQLVFNFEQTRTVTIFEEHGVMARIP